MSKLGSKYYSCYINGGVLYSHLLICKTGDYYSVKHDPPILFYPFNVKKNFGKFSGIVYLCSMEKLSILAAIAAIPAVLFILIAKINGSRKIIGWLGLKLPSIISLVALILMGMIYFGIIKLG